MARDPVDSGVWKLDWQTLVAIVGAAAALGVWINVVGGAVLWTRFHEADLPATHIVGLVPNTTLIGLGLQALALPLLVAVVAVGVFYVARQAPARPPPPPPPPPVPRRRFRDVVAALIILAAVRRVPPPPPPAEAPSPIAPATGMPGFGRVIILLAVLAGVAIFFTFGGEAHLPEDRQYVVAWALASPFLVVGAVTYEPFARWVRPRRWPYVVLTIVSFVGTLAIGFIVDHFWAAFWVALLAPMAAVLALLLPPGKQKLTTAGGWLIVVYLLLGVLLFFFSDGGGSLELHPVRDGVPILLAVLTTTIALLFLDLVGRRTSNAHLVAATMFAVVAVWGGVITYLHERSRTPTFDLTAMVRKPASTNSPRQPVSGFLIARTGDAILVATTSDVVTDESRILVVPRDQVELMAVGPSCVINDHNVAMAAKLASELEANENGTSTTTGKDSCTTTAG